MFRWLFVAMAVVVFFAGAAMLALGLRVNGAATLTAAVLFGIASELIAQNRIRPQQPA